MYPGPATNRIEYIYIYIYIHFICSITILHNNRWLFYIDLFSQGKKRAACTSFLGYACISLMLFVCITNLLTQIHTSSTQDPLSCL
jgi:tellurite resistance protein TehA-like permease